jgi:peptidoglycan L-alanyl-D-glutamate endopeptidase CwlK
MIIINPDHPAPHEIVRSIDEVNIRYFDTDGVYHDGTIEIHVDLADDVRGFFALAEELRFPIEHVVRSSDPEYAWDDDKLMAANTSSGFNYRLIKGTDRPSLHGLGRAFDINCRLNPYVRYAEDQEYIDPAGATYDPARPGTLASYSPLVLFMKEQGWTWGGDWTREEHGVTDYQHFEKRA